MESVLESSGKKNIEIIYDIPNNLDIFADVHMFETIIRNLASNAVKFTPKGGNLPTGKVGGSMFYFTIPMKKEISVQSD